jgi:hypothetical protein
MKKRDNTSKKKLAWRKKPTYLLCFVAFAIKSRIFKLDRPKSAAQVGADPKTVRKYMGR